MGFGSKYTQEVNAGGGSMADNDAYKKFVKSTLMDGITSQAEYLGSYIIDEMTNRGPQGSPLWFATYAKNKYSNEVEKLYGGIRNVSIVDNTPVEAVTERLVGHPITRVNSFDVGARTVETLAGLYVGENHKWHADNGLWSYFISDPDDEEGEPPVPEGKVQVSIILYIDDNFNRDDAEELDIMFDEPDDSDYVTIYYTYTNPHSSSVTPLGSTSESDTKPLPIDEDYFLGTDNTSLANVVDTTLTETIEKDVDGNLTVIDTSLVEIPKLIYEGEEKYIKVLEETDFSSKFREQVIITSIKQETEVTGTPPTGSGVFTRVTKLIHVNSYTSDHNEIHNPVKEIPAVISTPLANVPEISTETTSENITPIPLIPLRRIAGGVTEKFGTKGFKKRKRRSRWTYEWIRSDKNSYAGPNYNYKTLSHVVKKLFGKSMPKLVDEVRNGMSDQDKIQYMHIMYAVPLNTKNQGGMRYLIEFFKKYSNNSPTLLDNYRDAVDNWNNRPDSSIGYNPPKPPSFRSLNMSLRSNTRVDGRYGSRSARGGFHRTYSYQAAYGTGSGQYKNLKRGECVIEYSSPDLFTVKVREDITERRSRGGGDGNTTYYYVKTGERIVTENLVGSTHTIYHQISPTKYEYAIVFKASCRSIEAWGHSTEETLSDMLGAGEGDTIVTVPVYAELLRTLPAKPRGDCAYGSAMITYGVAYRGKQAGTFKRMAGMILLVIVTAVTFVVSGPGAAFVAMALSGLVMVGFMDKVIKVVADILTALGIPESVARQIAAVVVTIVVMVLSGGVDTTSLLSTASAGLSATSAAMNAKFSYEAELLEKEAQAFASEAEEIQKELDEASEELAKIGMPDYDLGNFFDSSNNIDLSTSGLKAFESLSDSLSMLRASAADSIEFDRALNQHFILIEKSLFQTISSNMVDVHYSK